jgi:hypothetical protein
MTAATKPVTLATVRIGVTLLPKRGRSTLEPLEVVNVRRPDRQALVRPTAGILADALAWDGASSAKLSELRRNYVVDAESLRAVLKTAKRALRMGAKR